MNDLARTCIAENRVVLILTIRGEAAVPALLEAEELFLPKIPATWALVEIAADRAPMPYLRGTDLARCCAGLAKIGSRDDRADRPLTPQHPRRPRRCGTR